MTGAEWGGFVALSGPPTAIGLRSDSCEIYNNYRGGIYFDATNETQHIVGNRIFGSVDGSSTGMYASATSGALVENNAVYKHVLRHPASMCTRVRARLRPARS